MTGEQGISCGNKNIGVAPANDYFPLAATASKAGQRIGVTRQHNK
jgi:hypothetical protein